MVPPEKVQQIYSPVFRVFYILYIVHTILYIYVYNIYRVSPAAILVGKVQLFENAWIGDNCIVRGIRDRSMIVLEFSPVLLVVVNERIQNASLHLDSHTKF